MKFPIVVLGAFLCLGAFAQGQANNPNNKDAQQQSANRVKRPADGTAQSVTGCVDEENGHYVLRDVKTDQLVRLQPSGESADNDFARFVGHQAQASGSMSGGTLTVSRIGQVADMCPIGK
ncbi:MAG TPA: hypothetical protein VMB03_24165 [Bryobacteraceae bacterium]|nr:hypothetical protein [Bryobacteraceae bacterium]